MKAVRLVQPGQPLELHDVPIPLPGPHDVLVRVKAAGICHSDAHYRAGISSVEPLPMTLGHEVAGVVEQIGGEVKTVKPGDRVCLHYLATCGDCHWCRAGNEQFCGKAQMIGKHRAGGFAEFIVMPARSVFALPDEIPFPQGAILMCSSATSLHALRQARMQPGESVAVFGAGGLGSSAIQLALALGASAVFAVDITPASWSSATTLGATPINAASDDPVAVIQIIPRRSCRGAGLRGPATDAAASRPVARDQGRAALRHHAGDSTNVPSEQQRRTAEHRRLACLHLNSLACTRK